MSSHGVFIGTCQLCMISPTGHYLKHRYCSGKSLAQINDHEKVEITSTFLRSVIRINYLLLFQIFFSRWQFLSACTNTKYSYYWHLTIFPRNNIIFNDNICPNIFYFFPDMYIFSFILRFHLVYLYSRH